MVEFKKLKILIVEDDYLVTDMIKRTLTDLGMSDFIEAANGKQAIKMVIRSNPDLVIMDIEMPEMNGIEATRQIQKRCPTPIIILSAFETAELIQQASEAGASAYLLKPMKKHLVEKSIVVALARHKDLMMLLKLNRELDQKNLQLKKLNRQLKAKNDELAEAFSEIKILRGILPICSKCKKIRDDEGFWKEVSGYLAEHTGAKFSHGICPECIEQLYRSESWYKDEQENDDT